MGGFSVDNMQLRAKGPLYDRQFMLVDEHGKFLSQRELPLMSQFKTEIVKDVVKVSLQTKSIELKLTDLGTKDCLTKVWRQEIRARQFSDNINEWFSEKLKFPCRLVSPSPNNPRIRTFTIPPYKSKVSFADGYPYLILGSKSLDALNKRLSMPIGMERFRPNIVVRTSEPNIEDNWKEIKIGSAILKVIKPCARCVMTTIDQNSGERNVEPLNTLREYRKFGKNILFGVNAILLKGINIKIGDKIELITKIEK